MRLSSRTAEPRRWVYYRLPREVARSMAPQERALGPVFIYLSRPAAAVARRLVTIENASNRNPGSRREKKDGEVNISDAY